MNFNTNALVILGQYLNPQINLFASSALISIYGDKAYFKPLHSVIHLFLPRQGGHVDTTYFLLTLMTELWKNVFNIPATTLVVVFPNNTF